MEYFKNDLSLPCSGLKVMTKSRTNFWLRPFVNPILSKPKSLNFMTKLLHSFDFSLKVKTIFCPRPFVNPDPGPVFKKGLGQGLGLKLRLLS